MKMVLKVDKGLAAHLKAIARGVGIYGGVEETAIYFIRSGCIDNMANENLRAMTEPHLPKRYRGQGRVYEALKGTKK